MLKYHDMIKLIAAAALFKAVASIEPSFNWKGEFVTAASSHPVFGEQDLPKFLEDFNTEIVDVVMELRKQAERIAEARYTLGDHS